jgi:hypothetical protein
MVDLLIDHTATKVFLPILPCRAGYESLEVFGFNGQNGGGHLAGTCQGEIPALGKALR